MKVAEKKRSVSRNSWYGTYYEFEKVLVFLMSMHQLARGLVGCFGLYFYNTDSIFILAHTAIVPLIFKNNTGAVFTRAHSTVVLWF